MASHPGDQGAGNVTAARLSEAFGCIAPELAHALLNDALRSLNHDRDSLPDVIEDAATKALQFVSAMAPADAHEAALIVQMFACHEAIARAHRQLARSGTIEQQDSAGRLVKIGRAHV